MLFVEIGREVLPRNIALRNNKAVITGIKDNQFVVIMKQDKTFELVRICDIVLSDKVYTEDELKNDSCEFFKKASESKKMNDFERFKIQLEKRVVEELISEKKLRD